MIQNIVKVKSTTSLPTKDKKKTYLSVVWEDGGKEYKKPIFDPALQKVFQEAEKSGEFVNVGVDKEGDFWNVKTAEITSAHVSQTAPVPETRNTGTRKSYGKSQDEEDWTNIRTAVMQATAMRTHLVPEAKTDIKSMMQDAAEIFAGMGMLKPSRSKDA